MATPRKRTLDFTGVETFEKLPEGYYKVKIARIKETRSQGGNDMFRIAFQVVSGSYKGSTIFENYPLVESALWKLKSLLQAIGMKADGRVQIDLDKMTGKLLEICINHEEYNGQMRARISETSKVGTNDIQEEPKKPADDDVTDDFEDEEEESSSDVDDFDDEEEDEPEEKPEPKKTKKKPEPETNEEPPKKRRGRKKKVEEPEPEPEPEEDEEEIADFDDDEDEELDDFEDFDEE